MIIHEHLLLNVHVSFEELSLFAGKEGGQDARRVLPLLKKWAESRDSRQAVWHAGQILREATALAPEALRDFHAIALYHAGLTLWAYGILSIEMNRLPLRRSRSYSNSVTAVPPPQEVIYLDGLESAEMHKFISLSRATPVIQQWSFASADKNPDSRDNKDPITLDNPKAVMEIVINVLQGNYEGKLVPPLVENLTHLMQDLSRAASKISIRR